MKEAEEEKKKKNELSENDIAKLAFRGLPTTTASKMKTKRVSFGTAMTSEGMYVLGGFTQDFRALNSVEFFSFVTASWTTLPGMQQCRSGCGAVAVGTTRIFVFGGKDEGPLDTVEVYDTIDQKWTYLKDMSVRRCGCVAVVLDHGNMICVLGGHDGTQLLDSMDILDVNSLEWCPPPVPLPPMNMARTGFGAVAVMRDDRFRIYVFGGRDSQGRRVGSVEALDVVVEATECRWKEVASLSTPRYGCVAVPTRKDRYVFVMGGYNGCGRPLQTCEVLDVMTETWSGVLPLLSTPRVGSGAAYDESKQRLILVGGLSGAEVLDTTEQMHLKSHSESFHEDEEAINEPCSPNQATEVESSPHDGHEVVFEVPRGSTENGAADRPSEAHEPPVVAVGQLLPTTETADQWSTLNGALTEEEALQLALHESTRMVINTTPESTSDPLSTVGEMGSPQNPK
mmetsp:Transcript_2210/g.5169  ORF Transcript_2210/g.5169 Transcript_2210/m.5169 type:complete len:455 (+) Transcript_2210:53-1417(+)